MSAAFEEGAAPGRSNEVDRETAEYLRMARNAVENGQFRLAVCLYLTAFEQDFASNQSNPTPAAIACLRKAWTHACDLKDRAMAEHIFERLSPHLPAETVSEYSRKLQKLSLEKLEDFGLSHDDVEGMADFLTGITEGMPGGSAKVTVKASSDDVPRLATVENELVSPSAPYGLRIDANKDKPAPAKRPAPSAPSVSEEAKAPDAPEAQQICFRDLAGYDGAIQKMKALGFGAESDERYAAFLRMLSRRHGVEPRTSSMPMVFRSQAREDATYFMHAVVGELDQPSVRMHVETTSQGLSMLSVSATSDFKSKQQLMQMNLDRPMTLILEDVDLWFESLPALQQIEDPTVQGGVAHGVREAVSMVRPAIMNPNITVVASCSIESEVDSLFFGILEPATVVDIDLPTQQERMDLWEWLADKFPSLRYFDYGELARLTESMTRYDICSAASEAVDQAYRDSIARTAYVPVTKSNLYEKIASFLPLDSREYEEAQEKVLERFRKELDHIDDLLNGDA